MITTAYEWDAAGVRLVNPTNARTHWTDRAARAKGQRAMAFLRTLAAVPPQLRCITKVDRKIRVAHGEPLPTYVVTITRIGKGRALDSDSLPASAKHIRDGIADALAIDDGDESAATWRYAQERGKDWGVRVTIDCKEES